MELSWAVGYHGPVERRVRVFNSQEEAARAEAETYGSMTPEARWALLLELIEQVGGWGEATERLARVYRVVELERR